MLMMMMMIDDDSIVRRRRGIKIYYSLILGMRKLNKADTHIFTHYPLLALSHFQFHARLKTILLTTVPLLIFFFLSLL